MSSLGLFFQNKNDCWNDDAVARWLNICIPVVRTYESRENIAPIDNINEEEIA